jgi:hypothetical protein
VEHSCAIQSKGGYTTKKRRWVISPTSESPTAENVSNQFKAKVDKTARHVTYFAGSEIVDRKNVNSQFKAKATLFSRLSNRRPKKCQHSIQSKGTYVGTTAM